MFEVHKTWNFMSALFERSRTNSAEFDKFSENPVCGLLDLYEHSIEMSEYIYC